MEEKRFENFLRKKHHELYPMVLDDDLPDHFDEWLVQLNAHEVVELGEEFADKAYELGWNDAEGNMRAKFD